MRVLFMKKRIRKIFEESIQTKQKTLELNEDFILQAVEEITNAIKQNKKILFFGNGGSAADSQHIAAEFIGRFKKDRKALAAIALTTDTSILTAVGNDYGFEAVFARQVEGLAQKGDIVFAFSTSGNSKNVLKAVKQARKMGVKTISLTGCQGGQLAKLTDISIIVPSSDTARIQEAHLCTAHAICELVENAI